MIESVVSTRHGVMVKLENGVEILISPNGERICFHFSGVEVPIVWGPSTGPQYTSANVVECTVKPTHEDWN